MVRVDHFPPPVLWFWLPTTTSGLFPVQTFHESIVEENEIDELGHLSVPFYEARALSASQALLSDAGLDPSALRGQGVELTLVDAFSRNLREQFLGASLAVRGGVLQVESEQVRLYQEIVNTDSEEVAAVYVQTFELQSTAGRETSPFAADVRKQLSNGRIDWPPHGQPRSLDLSRPLFPLHLAEAKHRSLAARPPRTIEPDECNAQGYLEPARFQHLPYSGPGSEDPTLQWVFETSDGIRVGLADLETRNVLLSLPRVGDRIQVFSAEVAIARKTIQRNHWVFDLNTEAPLSAGSVVMACLDLDARRALEIAGPLREMFERRYHPDLN